MTTKNFIDRTDVVYGKLTVTERAPNNKWSQAVWKCKCECGRDTLVDAANLSTGHTVSCGRCILVVDFTGRIFGNLTVIGIDIDNPSLHGVFWWCVCSCSPTNKISISAQNLRSGQKSCGCSRRGENNPLYGGRVGKIHMTYWTRLLTGAVQRNLEVSVSLQYIADLYDQQHGKCALSGLELIPPTINRSDWTASLDRIDNEKGYVEGNLQWIHKDINMMKRHHDQDYFINMCRAVAHKSKECASS